MHATLYQGGQHANTSDRLQGAQSQGSGDWSSSFLGGSMQFWQSRAESG